MEQPTADVQVVIAGKTYSLNAPEGAAPYMLQAARRVDASFQQSFESMRSSGSDMAARREASLVKAALFSELRAMKLQERNLHHDQLLEVCRALRIQVDNFLTQHDK